VAQQLDQVVAGAGLAGDGGTEPFQPAAPSLRSLLGRFGGATTVVLGHCSKCLILKTPSGAAGPVYRVRGDGPNRRAGPGRRSGTVRQPIGVFDPQPGQDLALELLHRLGLAAVAV